MDLRVESTRGTTVESFHHVSAAVVDAEGRLLASTGDPDVVTFWRSAAKPFQALPVVSEGAADRFEFDEKALALSCASHSSEPMHLEVVDAMLRRGGLTEQELACGPHPPLSPLVAESVLRHGIVLTPRWSNCSGKHSAMLALAKHRGWALSGYVDAGHPLQQRLLQEIARWTGVPVDKLVQSVDGCTAVCYGLPIRAMALAYARFGASTDAGTVRLRAAMTRHPQLVAGTDRACTDLMAAWPGRLVAKIGADGIYCAALPEARLGIALKLQSGDMRGSPVALLAILRQLDHKLSLGLGADAPVPSAARHAELPIVNTRGAQTGVTRATGTLRFSGR